MSTNLNSIYSSCTDNISYTHKSSTERTINYKDIGSYLSETQLENEKKADTYVNEIKNCVPKTTVTIRSMTDKEVSYYCEKWKQQPVDYSGFKHDIVVSSKVLEKMEKDPEYAKQMIQKIKKAAVPEGLDNFTIYEYKVVVRDDGEIETWVCAGMNEKNKKIDNDDDDKKKVEKKRLERKKAEKETSDNKELELIYANRRLYDQWKSQTLSEEKIKINPFTNQQYLFHAEVVNKIGTENEDINLK